MVQQSIATETELPLTQAWFSFLINGNNQVVWLTTFIIKFVKKYCSRILFIIITIYSCCFTE